jgi:hypothetical protein
MSVAVAHTQTQAPGRRLTRTKGWPPPIRKAVPFSGLMLFTFVLFVAPQQAFPVLQPLMLAKLSIGLAVIGYVANRTATGRRLTIMTSPVRWALVLGLLALLSIPAGFWPGGSVGVFLDLFAKSLVVFLLVANVVDTERRFRLLVGSMLAWGVLAALVAIVNFVTGRFDMRSARIVGYESSIALNPNDLALTLNILLGLAIGLYAATTQRRQRLFIGAAMGVLVAGVVVSFSRSGFVVLATVLAIWTARRFRERGARVLLFLIPAMLVAALVIPEGYSERLATITDSKADTSGSSAERWETMMLALRLTEEYPVFGVGLGNNVHVSVDRGGPVVAAHNAYLMVGAELGIFAAIAYVLFITSSLAAARAVRRFFDERVRHEGWELGRLAGGVELALIAFAVGALFSPVPYHFYLYYPAGLAVALFAIGARVPPRPARAQGA